jgi:hypothetical protein
MDMDDKSRLVHQRFDRISDHDEGLLFGSALGGDPQNRDFDGPHPSDLEHPA